ncbi:MAG: phosphohistidine phosphatase SixA [Pleurocapsa sp.]
MEVYLIRHGIAATRGTYVVDEERPLTPKGNSKTTDVAKRLQSIGLKFDLILTSPLVRAYQTANILQKADLSQKIEQREFLAPEGDINQWLEWLQAWQLLNPDSKLALVGHQPDLGNWAEMLVWGSIKEQIVLKKAGVIGIEIPGIGTPICRSRLFLLTSPKWLLLPPNS